MFLPPGLSTGEDIADIDENTRAHDLPIKMRAGSNQIKSEDRVVSDAMFGQSNAEFVHFIRFISPYCVTNWAIFNNAAEHSCLAPKMIC